MIHLLGIAAATAGIILCTILPFLPGRYDTVAVPLSMISQLFGIVGLLLVPVGIVWAASEFRGGSARKRRILAFVALAAFSVVWLVVSLGAFLESLTLGLASVALWACIAWSLFRRSNALTDAPGGTLNPAPFYLVVVPIAVAVLQMALARPVTEFSRNRAIRNSAALIADIEQYRATNGRYPASIVSVNKDYWPSVIGIREYVYEPSGEAYNLFFEQITFELGVREIVMYNPRDEQVMTSHAMDVLQMTPEQLQLDRTRGHNAVYAASQPHWKYFWFD